MRVGHLSFFYWPVVGGQEIYIANLNRMLRAHGHTTRVYQPSKPGVAREKSVVAVPDPPAVARVLGHLGLWHWQWHTFTWLLALTRGKQLREEDLLISHYAVHSPALRRLQSRTIVLSHGVEWSREKPTVETRWRETIARWAFRRFTTVANDTEYLRHFGVQVDPGTHFFEEVAPGKWFIPNCVDTTVFHPRQGSNEFGERRAIMVPRVITKDRGIDIAIRAFKLVCSQDDRLALYVVGGPKEGRHYEYCLGLAESLGLRDRVVFYGPVSHGRMPRLYNSAAVTLIPTLRREGTSLSALESMACGTATVSTNVEGLKDLPTIQADPVPHALAGKLRDTLSRCPEIGRDQAARVRETFNTRNWERAWLRVISAVTGSA